jgi:anti-anti-sigma regulatory factor
LRLVQGALSNPACRAARDEATQWLSELALRISSAPPADACPCVIVDLQDVSFMDDGGSGLPVSILRCSANEGSFVVAFVGGNRNMESYFELLRFDRVLLIYPDAATAIREIRQHPQPGSKAEWGTIMNQLLAGAAMIRQTSANRAGSHDDSPRPSVPSPAPCPPTVQPAPLQWETTFPNSAEAKRVLDDLTNRGALHGFGPPEIENTLFKILSTFEANGDWHLALEALSSLTNIHSTQNDLFEMASRCRKGLEIAKRLGEEGSVRFFQNCLDSANRREQQATRWRFAAACVFVMGLIAVGSAVLFWAIGFN